MVLVYTTFKNLAHLLSRQTWMAVLLTVALLGAFTMIYRLTGFDVSWIMLISIALWVAIDSTKIHLEGYESGISYTKGVTNASPSRLLTVDALRGIAALSVCWYHFTHFESQSGKFLFGSFLKSTGRFGWLGIGIFFVISGFIIPYALQRSGYDILDDSKSFLKGTFRFSDYGTFILKRIIRLEPPYWIAILVAIGWQFATPGFKMPAFHFLFVQTLLHLVYLNKFLGYPWFNAVFWTLAIELQYYLLIGLFFPIIAHRSLIVRVCCFGLLASLALTGVGATQYVMGFFVFVKCLAALAFTNADQFVFWWLFLFMLGMAAFQLRVGLCQRRQFFFWMLAFGFGTWYVNGIVIAIIAIATALLLGLVDTGTKNPLLFFGRISYSLYLLHLPIGYLIFTLSMPFVHTMLGKCAILAAALAVSIVSAWLLYRFVERPAQEWSSRIRYRKKKVVASSIANRTQTYVESTPL